MSNKYDVIFILLNNNIPVMDLVLDTVDHLLLDSLYTNVPRDNIVRQAITLFSLTLLFITVFYFSFAYLSFTLFYDKEQMKHPKYLKNQVYYYPYNRCDCRLNKRLQ